MRIGNDRHAVSDVAVTNVAMSDAARGSDGQQKKTVKV